jgi:hypothetical protein
MAMANTCSGRSRKRRVKVPLRERVSGTITVNQKYGNTGKKRTMPGGACTGNNNKLTCIGIPTLVVARQIACSGRSKKGIIEGPIA